MFNSGLNSTSQEDDDENIEPADTESGDSTSARVRPGFGYGLHCADDIDAEKRRIQNQPDN